MAVYHHGLPRWDCYSFGFVAGTAYTKRAYSYSYLPAWRNQGRAPAVHVMLSILRRTPSKMIWPTLTILSACITTWTSHVEPVLVPSPPLVSRWRITSRNALGWPLLPWRRRKARPVGVCLKRVLLAPNTCKAKRKATVPRNPNQPARPLRTPKSVIGACNSCATGASQESTTGSTRLLHMA